MQTESKQAEYAIRGWLSPPLPQAKFQEMLVKWLAALVLGIPVFVLRDFFQARLALEWRQWMTTSLTADYFGGRAFYRVQARSRRPRAPLGAQPASQPASQKKAAGTPAPSSEHTGPQGRWEHLQ